MKMSTSWKSGKSGKKKHRAAYKPKIRWELLGLSNPDQTEAPTSIETIREQVSTLARGGFGMESRSLGTRVSPTGRGRNRPATSTRIPRRGATE